jgi:hypothetical protein
MKLIVYSNVKSIFPSSSGARPALPMGVAPEAMVGYLEAIVGSEILLLLLNLYTPLMFPFS